jgi:hypothetical protein
MKIFLGISIIVNAILMMFLFGVIPFLLYATVVVFAISLFYTRHLLVQRAELLEDINSLFLEFANFDTHLAKIYELEMFYGDETLEGLIGHSRKMIERFYSYEDKYMDYDTLEDDKEKEEDNYDREEDDYDREEEAPEEDE